MRQQFFITAKKQSAGQSRARASSRWLNRLLSEYSEEKAAALMAKFKEKRCLANSYADPSEEQRFFQLLEDAIPSDDRTKSIPAGTLANWKKIARRANENSFRRKIPNCTRSSCRNRRSWSTKCKKAGVKILAGTDSPRSLIFSLVQACTMNCNCWCKAGLTPLEALQSATKNPAEFSAHRKGFRHHRKRESTPTSCYSMQIPWKISATLAKIRAVILHGKLLDRSALDAPARKTRKVFRH